MNERIQELMKQSMVEYQFDLRFSPELFAELIVKKCLSMIENEAAQYAEPVWAVELLNDIKEHFGVEE